MISSTVRNGRVFLSSDKQELHCVACGRWCKLLVDGECWTCAAGISVPQEDWIKPTEHLQERSDH